MTIESQNPCSNYTTPVPKTRDGNMELLRIISMIMIVTLHYLDKGGILNANKGSLIYYLSWFLETLCYVAVNLYVFISGYYISNCKFKLNRILDLGLQASIIAGGAYIVALRFGIVEEFSLGAFAESLMPIPFNAYWFISTYVIFFGNCAISLLCDNLN